MSELVEARLTDDEAEHLARLLSTLRREMNEQYALQGLSNEPIKYDTLVRNNYVAYLNERYSIEL